MRRSHWRDILLIEDNAARIHRRRPVGALNGAHPVKICVHRIDEGGCRQIAEKSYRPGTLHRKVGKAGRAAIALSLLDGIGATQESLIVAGPVYGENPNFLRGLESRGLPFAVEIRASKGRRLLRKTKGGRHAATLEAIMRSARWTLANVSQPGAPAPMKYSVATIAEPQLADGSEGRFFAVQTGRISGIHRGTILALTSLPKAPLSALLRAVGWIKWIRPATRRSEKKALGVDAPLKPPAKGAPQGAARGIPIKTRTNIRNARAQDSKETWHLSGAKKAGPKLRGAVAKKSKILNVVELFAGAGGMGLGFLLARSQSRRYRLTYSGEINPIYVRTLRTNHAAFEAWETGRQGRLTPAKVEAADLSREKVLQQVCRTAAKAGPVHVLIGGPPCQGFSNANRNSWHSSNPNNRLVNVFLRYVEKLQPAVFVMENVQGIMWTPKVARREEPPSVLQHFAARMNAAGYMVFPKLLDAVWYGVPQHRSRFFLLGLRKDLGYRREDFGAWGPFPLPTHGPGCANGYVTLREAIDDLPKVGNGMNTAMQRYDLRAADERLKNPFLASMRDGAPTKVISDHVTSRHADYVIERYRRIPAGGNWEDIADQLTNYANVERTHSNIYRRLKWNEPAITIGHYRKSMLVHPSQHRGLSLREASRLQSFPDWFRFSGGCATAEGGLGHKQQQLANAVCPLVTKALAELILEL